MLVSLNEQFIDEEKVLRISGDNGIQWETVKPADLRGNFDVVVQTGSTLPSNDAVNKKQTMELYQLFAGDPDVNQIELKKMVAGTFDNVDVAKLFPESEPLLGMQGENQNLTQSPGIPEGQTDQQGILGSALAPERV